MLVYPKVIFSFFSGEKISNEILNIYQENFPILLNILSKLQPLLLLFVLPGLILLIFYLTCLVIYLYKLQHFLFGNWGSGIVTEATLRRFLSMFWCFKGRILHGYEIFGLEKIPRNESAYIIYFHGTLPLDIYYFATNFILSRGKIPVCVVDRFLFHLPGFRILLDFMNSTSGSVEGCVKLLTQSKEILLLSPGGVREAFFSENYNVMWGKRRGFAKIAIEAKKPVYPMFTENIQEPIRVVQFGKSFWINLYEKTRIPFVFLYGYFPSKLRTYIGDPIYPMENEDVDVFADRVKKSIEEMIIEKQILPGSIIRSIAQRCSYFDSWFHHQYESVLDKFKKKI